MIVHGLLGCTSYGQCARFAPEHFRREFMAIVEQTIENNARSTPC